MDLKQIAEQWTDTYIIFAKALFTLPDPILLPYAATDPDSLERMIEAALTTMDSLARSPRGPIEENALLAVSFWIAALDSIGLAILSEDDRHLPVATLCLACSEHHARAVIRIAVDFDEDAAHE